MAKFILGTKAGMTQIYAPDGKLTAVTLIQVSPNKVIQVKTKEKDGYAAVQIGTGSKKKLGKSLKGHFKDLGTFAHVREFKADKEMAVGDTLGADVFEVGDSVKVSGVSKGKGFAGAVKRHGFAGSPASHGHGHVIRHVGSIGQRFPQHTLRGLRMAGRDGGLSSSVRNLTVMTVDTEAGVIALKGAVPGPNGSLVRIVSMK